MMDWEREIVELHEYFEQLFLGQVTSLDRAEEALAATFTMVGPDGTLRDRATVLDQLAAGIGHTDELTIVVEDLQLVVETGAVVVASYVEIHELRDGRGNERLTTAVFRRDDEAPNGALWLRAHETFIRRDEPT